MPARTEGQNWVNDRAPLLSRPPAPPRGGPLPPGLTGGAQGYTRQVQPDELMSTHAATLASGDNRLIRDARARGVAAGASRGGINSNLAAMGGEQAALGQVAEMAAQQAGAYGAAAGQNLDSVRQQRIAAEGNQAQITSADIGAGASMYGSDRDFEAAEQRNILDRDRMAQDRDLTLSDREYRAGESQRERDYNTGRDETQFGYQRRLNEDQYGYDQRARDEDFNRTLYGELATRVFDDPETWDEVMASGMFELFGIGGRAWRRPASTQPTNPGGT